MSSSEGENSGSASHGAWSHPFSLNPTNRLFVIVHLTAFGL
ncbi:Uncharacterised protein [Mycobacteroides abscessus subsp. abscessus]|nr:Uncharacterised protein [Mycobacteroides abscessus subsp. abscessus]